jgi:hypothetical protein
MEKLEAIWLASRMIAADRFHGMSSRKKYRYWSGWPAVLAKRKRGPVYGVHSQNCTLDFFFGGA